MSKKRALWSKSIFSQEDCSDSSEKDECVKKLSRTSFEPTFNSKHLRTKDEQINSKELLKNFKPNCFEELAVHPKKLKEIENWIEHCNAIKKRCPSGQILLITGPTGSGKLTSVKVIAKQMKYELVEWITPVDVQIQFRENSNEGLGVYKESQLEIFKRFLFQSSRYSSLFDQENRRLILVKDIPNVFIQNANLFHEVLQQFKSFGKSPLIFIATDSKTRQLNINYNLFPDDIKNQYKIEVINLNSISTTLMKKALNQISNLMASTEMMKYYKIPDQHLIDSIILSAQGDIRNACINLHFASLKGAPALSTFETNSKNSKKIVKKKSSKLSSIGCDETITLMHALGRVFYPKYKTENTSNNIKLLTHSPELISEQFSSEPKNFLNFTFANYATHFGDVESLCKASDIISTSDLLMTEYRDEQLSALGLNIAIRGAMVNNSNPVSHWSSIRGPKKIAISGNYLEELKCYGILSNVSRNVLASDYRSYGRIIKKPNPV